MVKKGFMMHIWRIQQSSAFINLMLWSLTLTAVLFKDYVQIHFVRLGIITNDPGQYGIGMLMLFSLVFCGILFSGWIYDRILQLWREQAIVTVERNPFAHERQTPKEILNWEMNQIPILRRLGLHQEADFNTRWNYRTMRIDPLVKIEVLKLMRTIRDSPLPEPENRFVRASLVEKVGKHPDGSPMVVPKGFHHCTECRHLVDESPHAGRFACPRCGKPQDFKGGTAQGGKGGGKGRGSGPTGKKSGKGKRKKD